MFSFILSGEVSGHLLIPINLLLVSCLTFYDTTSVHFTSYPYDASRALSMTLSPVRRTSLGMGFTQSSYT